MSTNKLTSLRLSDRDLDFLVEAAAPDVRNKSNLKKIIRQDEDFRNAFIGDENVFHRLMADDEIFLKISPALFFEILFADFLVSCECNFGNGRFFKDVEDHDLSLGAVFRPDVDILKKTHSENGPEVLVQFFGVKAFPFFAFHHSNDGLKLLQ